MALHNFFVKKQHFYQQKIWQYIKKMLILHAFKNQDPYK